MGGDRRYLADLWPEGWIVPSILRQYRTICPEERSAANRQLEDMEAERELVEAIRAGVAAAAKVTRDQFRGKRWQSRTCFKDSV